MGWKRMILGEDMPDKDDPKYKERREKEVEAGKKAAKMLRVDKIAAGIQKWALRYPRLFLCTVFGIVTMCLGYNITCMVRTYKNQPAKETAVQRQDAALNKIRKARQETGTVEEYEKGLKEKIGVLTSKGNGMTGEDSIKVRLLMEEMIRLEQLKNESR